MFYVYKWYIKSTNEIFYIGKGYKNRYKQVKKRNKLFLEVFNNNECDVEIIEYFENEKEAFEKEHELICYYKSKGQCKCNLDYGGRGGVNFIWTPEMREYYSKYNIMKSEHQRKRMSEKNPMKNPEIAKRVGQKFRKHPIINGKFYEKVEDASSEYNVSIATIRTWCKQGYNTKNEKCHWSNEKPKNIEYVPHSGRKVIYDNEVYNSVKDLAQDLGYSKSTITQWLKQGFSTNGIVCRYLDDKNEYIFKPHKKTSSKAIIINGVRYESVKEASRKLRINDTTLHYHIHNNTGRYQCKYDNQ